MTIFAALFCLIRLSAGGPVPGAEKTVNWPCFRGPASSGIAEGYATPMEWNVESSKGMAWKTPIPGLGHSSPVVWGDRVFVTTAISGKADDKLKVGLYGDITPVDDASVHTYLVLCLDKSTGKVLWQREAYKGVPKVKRHTKSTHANPSPATDGTRVVVSFGSEGLYCYDFAGILLWKKDLGLLDSGYYQVPDAQWGFASSPLLADGRVYLQCDVQKNSFLAALDAKDGHEIWRTRRGDVPTWSTPAICREGGRRMLVVNGYNQIAGYDADTGKNLWQMMGGGDIPVPTPLVANGLVYITNAHGRMAPIYAVRPTARGELKATAENPGEHLAWMKERGGAYMQTPLAYGDYLYICRDTGVLSCYEAKTGKDVYSERLGTGRTGFTASGVAADGKLYYTSEEGEVYVVRAGPKLEVLATNPLGEVCMSTPAISAGSLIFRTQGHVVCIK